jgi:hypothetical protein
VFSAVMSGLLAGTGILILMRHQASLGGLGALAFYLQQRRGWRAGTVQMLCDAADPGLGPVAAAAGAGGAVGAVGGGAQLRHRH